MKKSLLILFAFALVSSIKVNAQIINPGFETWSVDMLVPTAMNPNGGNNTFGWWDYNFFNSSFVGSSPISVVRCSDTVRTGSYSVRLESKVYTPTSWNMYKNWGIPFIGHVYNDTLGILFNGNVNVTNQSYKPGIPCNQSLAQFKFYYQYRPKGNDTAECRVELMSAGTSVAGGVFKTSVATGNSGWQQATINFSYISGLTPDTLFVLFSATSLDHAPKAGSVLWIDDVSASLVTDASDISPENNILLFPNPSNGSFTVKFENFNSAIQSQARTIEIINMLGEIIYSAKNNGKPTCDIDISNSPRGMYFVKIYDGVKYYTKKIEKQ
ncbi:MAG: T9SS type A sorting domain-containing protein [Bacteroidota bacterium]